MIFQLFPAVTFTTVHVEFTFFLIFSNKVVRIPITTRDRFILMFMRSPSIILPIVCVIALTSIVLNIVKRTPKRFIVEDEEVSVRLVMVNKFHSNLVFSMSKRTKHAILTV